MEDFGASVALLLLTRLVLLEIAMLGWSQWKGDLAQSHILGEIGERRELLGLSLLRASACFVWLLALQCISFVEASCIVYSSPVLAALLGHFFVEGEQVTAVTILCLLTAVAGIVVLMHPWTEYADAGQSLTEQIAGLSFSVLYAVFSAVYQVVSRKYRSISYTVVTHAFCIYSLLFACLGFVVVKLSGIPVNVSFEIELHGNSRLFVLMYACSTALHQVFQLVSFQSGSIAWMGLLAFLFPILSLLTSLFLLGQPISPLSAAGCILICGSGSLQALCEGRGAKGRLCCFGGYGSLPSSATSGIQESPEVELQESPVV